MSPEVLLRLGIRLGGWTAGGLVFVVDRVKLAGASVLQTQPMAADPDSLALPASGKEDAPETTRAQCQCRTYGSRGGHGTVPQAGCLMDAQSFS